MREERWTRASLRTMSDVQYVCTRSLGEMGFSDMVLNVDAGKRLFAGERSASYVHEAELHSSDSLTPDEDFQSRGRGSKRV